MLKSYYFIALSILILALCVFLGFWQIDRAEEKRILLEKIHVQSIVPVTDWKSAEDAQIIFLVGQYDTSSAFLLDNQSYEGAVGYDLIVPFITEASSIVFMVNLGWVEADINRNVLPEIELPSHSLEIKVRVYKPSKQVFRLSENQYANTGWPKRIQYFSSDYFMEELRHKYEFATQVVFYETRIEERQLGGQIRHWNYQHMPPEKHVAYAVQWFSLAIVIFLLSIFFLQKSIKERGNESS